MFVPSASDKTEVPNSHTEENTISYTQLGLDIVYGYNQGKKEMAIGGNYATGPGATYLYDGIYLELQYILLQFPHFEAFEEYG